VCFFLSFSGHSRDKATYHCFLEGESRDKEIKKTRKQKIKVGKNEYKNVGVDVTNHLYNR
jgi:hypothetical protein